MEERKSQGGGKRLYVGNLNWETKEDTLRDEFSKAGTVEEVKVILKENGQSKGFGFVEMSTPEEAQKAIEMFNGKEFDGRPLTVNEARPPQPREDR